MFGAANWSVRHSFVLTLNWKFVLLFLFNWYQKVEVALKVDSELGSFLNIRAIKSNKLIFSRRNCPLLFACRTAWKWFIFGPRSQSKPIILFVHWHYCHSWNNIITFALLWSESLFFCQSHHKNEWKNDTQRRSKKISGAKSRTHRSIVGIGYFLLFSHSICCSLMDCNSTFNTFQLYFFMFLRTIKFKHQQRTV